MKNTQTLFLALVILLSWAGSAFAQSQQVITGNWEATLAIPSGQKLRLVLKVSSATGGGFKAVMDSLDQPGSNDLYVDSITCEYGAVYFEMKGLQISYSGSMNKDGSEIVGTFTQRGATATLAFRKPGATIRTNESVRRGSVDLKSCNNPAVTSDALCGKYEVFEDRIARKGRKIALNLVLLPATSAKPAPDPLFYLAGGPGGAATTYAREVYMSYLRRNRDVVLVDQRGTGKSNLLDCPSGGSRDDMSGYFGEVFPPERLRACRAELEK